MINRTLTPPILLISSPRTGSTAVGDYLKKFCSDPNVKYFPEPDFFGKKSMDAFVNYVSLSKNFIVKIHVDCLEEYPRDIQNFLLSDQTTKIRIRRRDHINQIASLYTSKYRKNTYHFFKDTIESHVADTVPIDDYKNLDWVIGFIFRTNKMLDESTIPFDIDLYYEDLPVMNDSKFLVVPKPINYNELLESIRNRIIAKSFK